MGDKLRFVFRNFPLTKIRPHAYETALAAEAAAAQGKFGTCMIIYSNMVTNDSLRRSAASLGLNLTKFDSDFYNRLYSNHIDEDVQSGNSSGVKGTPTFFINGELYNGSWDLDSLLGTLDEESVFSWKQKQ